MDHYESSKYNCPGCFPVLNMKTKSLTMTETINLCGKLPWEDQKISRIHKTHTKDDLPN